MNNTLWYQDQDLLSPVLLLKNAYLHFGRRLAFACSFSIEDLVIIDLMRETNSMARIVSLDTGRLPEETYACAEAISRLFGVSIEWQYPDADALQELVCNKGLFSFRDSAVNRKECCAIRKVEPLRKALKDVTCWITGQRKEQSVTRSSLEIVQNDDLVAGATKLNPLADWSFQETFQYVANRNLPYNKLYDYGYMSIGCAPCTRPVKEGEHERSGRWWWEEPEHKECGIHGSLHKSVQKL